MKSAQEGATLPQSGYSLARIATVAKQDYSSLSIYLFIKNNLRYCFYIYYIYYAKRNKQRRE